MRQDHCRGDKGLAVGVKMSALYYYVHSYTVSHWIVAAIMIVKYLLAIPVMTVHDLKFSW